MLPPALVLAAAIVGSLAVHVPIYAGLGVLASIFAERPPPTAPPTVEITLLEPPAPSSVPTEAEEDAAEAPEAPIGDDEPTPEPARPRRPPPRAVVRPPPPPERQRAPDEPPPVVVERPTPPPPSEIDERRAIVQRSQDPTVTNDDAQLIAEEASVVEEETVAAITNTVRDDPDQSPGPAHESAVEEPGNADDQVARDMRDEEGDDRRVVTREEAERERPQETSEPDPSTSPTPSAQGGESLDDGRDARQRAGERVRTEEGGARAQGGGERAADEIIVSDGFGTFTIRRPREAAVGEGGGEAGGRRVDGRGRGSSGEGLAGGRAGSSRGGARQGGAQGHRGDVQLGVTWSQLEAVYGEEELRRERTARLEERRSRARGTSRGQRWDQFRAALENYVPGVRTGNQTALNAAASPFATFLSDVHRRIHREFADRYIGGLGLDPPEGLGDQSLQTTLEIAVNPDGSIYRVGIVATSGNILFDFGAFNSVMRAQPFPAPPEIILSGDGHAWLHWRFDRGPRQCGTWNARPFMLENAPPLVDRGEPPEPGPRGSLPEADGDAEHDHDHDEGDTHAHDEDPRSVEDEDDDAPAAPPSEVPVLVPGDRSRSFGG